jgi:dihydropyrimidinase
MVSENPAKRLGLFPAKGCIQKGSDADITIIDPNTPVKTDIKDVNGEQLELSCSIKATFLRGTLMTPLKQNQKPRGSYVKRTGTTRRKSSSTCWN